MAQAELQPGVTRAHSWPAERADEALEALARRSGLVENVGLVEDEPGGQPRPSDDAASGAGGLSTEDLDPWIERVADRLGLEVESAEASYGEVADLARSCGPALLRIPDPDGTGGEARLLVILDHRRGRVRLLGPDLTIYRVTVAAVVDALCREIEAKVAPRVEKFLGRLDIAPRRLGRARAALLGERLRQVRIRGCWLLRLPPGSNFWRQLKHQGLPWELGKYLITYAFAYALLLLSWWTLGLGALSGNLSHDWLLAWGLILISSVLPRQWSTWAQAKLAVGVGTLMKRRLLQGALKLEPDEIRHQGAGQLLGRVIESEALQGYALIGGFMATVGGIELVMAAWVLGQGAAGGFHVLILMLWSLALGIVGWRFYVLRRRWTEARLEMTHDLVENLVGHRTRLAQERRERWHGREDRLLDGYLASSRSMDRHRAIVIVASFGWMLVGILGLLPAFVAGSSVTAIAITIGGILLASGALAKLSGGFTSLVGAWISWGQAGPIFRAAARSAGVPATGPSLARRQSDRENEHEPAAPLLSAQDVVYRYRDRARPVLDGCSLEIYRGDRILLEGPSGGGKSTLAGILTHLRAPSSGLLLLGGLDRHTVGPQIWRRHVVSAPQFHENHVFTETFAFNLLMGRRWPPTPEDLKEAAEVCRDLGLGELLERMPAGLLQLVGETGWQLSHGERSRLFMARALLQGTDLVILDESFAALDPENLHRALHCALDRAPTLLVIAHP